MNVNQLFFELSLILFSVSSVFTVSMLITRYPKIHRFGHTLEKTHNKRLNLKVMSISWLTMIALMLLVFVSLYFYFQSLGRGNFANWAVYCSFPLVYFLLPSLIERATTGATILLVRDDFNDYDRKPSKKPYLESRFSPATVDEIRKGNSYSRYMVVDSLLKFAILVLSPIFCYLWNWSWWGILGIASYLLLGLLTERIMLRRQDSCGP